MDASNLDSSFNASRRPCWTRRVHILNRHKLKSFKPVNFSTLYLVEVMII